MRRLEMAGKVEQVERIDNKLDWLYPLLYVASLAVVGQQFNLERETSVE